MAGCGCDVKFCELETWQLISLAVKWVLSLVGGVWVDLRGGGEVVVNTEMFHIFF